MNKNENLSNQDSPYILKDVMSGDEELTESQKFLELNNQDIKEALDFLSRDYHLSDKERYKLLNESWRINYRVKPPTIDEFLTEEWIGPTANSLFPHVREILNEYYQPDSKYRHLILASAIGTGKSFASSLWSLYVTVHLWAMRDPKKFFGLSQATSIVHGLISFTMEKAGQLLLQPFMQILLSSTKFRRVKMEERLGAKQKEYPNEICFTTAGKMGALQFYNDVHYILASSPANLLGLNMITAILSEISFFIDKGFSTEYIWRIYQDSKRRVYSRFEEQYFSGTVIDSSPNDIELSPIDKYIFSGKAEEVKNNYVVTGSQWDLRPTKFPEWQKTGRTFPVYRGSTGSPPEILHNENEIYRYEPEEIYFVPIDVKNLFEDDILKSVKDICGWPGGSLGTLLRDDVALEKMFDNSLKNIYTSINAPSNRSSKNLIWNEIKDRFFVKFDKGYEFYRNPLEKRFIHVDQAETGDIASISMVHPETIDNGSLVYITDFTIAISPEKQRINLDAIRLFLEDLKVKGHINIEMITFDQFQSSTTIQYLKGKGFNVDRLSVDRDTKPYYTYISYILSNRIKSGKNIFLKNNLKSLQEVVMNSGKKKIDHSKGKIVYYDGAKWDNSQMGKFAKDVSDSHCGAVWNAIHRFVGVPRYVWEDNKEKNTRVETIKNKVLKDLENRYGFQMEELEENLNG